MIWKETLNRIANGDQDIPSPFVQGAFIEYHYIILNEPERMGFLLAWCTKTLKGIQISRVKVPPNFPYLTKEEAEKMELPKIIWMDPLK